MSEGTKLWNSPTFVFSVIAAGLEAIAHHTEGKAPEPPQMLLLIALYNTGTMSQLELQKAIHAFKSKAKTPEDERRYRTATSRAIRNLGRGDPLDRKPGPDWVTAYRDPMDERYNLVKLTERGRMMMDNVIHDVMLRMGPLLGTM